MKIGRFLALGTLAYGAYYAYKRREDIKEEILDLNQSRENISHDLDNIKRNLDIIKEQNLVLADIKQDLNYKKRLQKDLEPRLNIIQERLQKYQGDDKESKPPVRTGGLLFG